MSLHPADGLRKFVIQAVNAVLLRDRAADDLTLTENQRPELFADSGIIADPFGDDVIGSM